MKYSHRLHCKLALSYFRISLRGEWKKLNTCNMPKWNRMLRKNYWKKSIHFNNLETYSHNYLKKGKDTASKDKRVYVSHSYTLGIFLIFKNCIYGQAYYIPEESYFFKSMKSVGHLILVYYIKPSSDIHLLSHANTSNWVFHLKFFVKSHRLYQYPKNLRISS